MREIKFRAWSKESEVMFTNEMLKNAANGMIKISKEALIKQGLNEAASNLQCGIFLPTEDKDLVFMQYTGLKDKNGKEIYEGDIFKDCEGKIKLVIWEDNGFKSKYTFKRRYQGEEWFENSITDLGDTQSRRWGVEVIGNIYENEDLLEK